MTTSSPFAAEPVPEPVLVGDSEGQLWTPAFLKLLLIQLSYGFSFSAFFLLPKYLKTEFAATPGEMGLVIGVGLFVSVLAVPAVGFGIDRLPRARLLQVGTLLGALAAGAHALVTEVGPLLYAARVGSGLAFVITFNTAATLAVDLAPKARLSQALGLFGVATLCTNAIAPVTVEPLASARGWQAGFALAAASALVATGIALSLPRSRSESKVRDRTALSGRYESRNWGVFYASLLVGLGFGSIITYSQPYALSLGAKHVSDLFVGYTLSAVAVRVVLGGLADRLGRHSTALAALALYGLVTLATAWLEPSWLFALGLGLGVAHGIVYPALNALVVEGVAFAQRGRVMTAFNGAFNLGYALSVLGLGRLAEAAGFKPIFLLAGALVLSGTVALARSARPAPPLSSAGSARLG